MTTWRPFLLGLALWVGLIVALVGWLLTCPLSAQVSTPTRVIVRDEGGAQGAAREIDCQGAGVACSVAGGVATVAVAGGGVTTIADEASPLTARPTLNFTGSGVACVDNAGATRTDCAITGGGGGGVNSVELSLDFGVDLATVASATVTGQTWVTATSRILCQPFPTTTDGQTEENYLVAGLTAIVMNRVVGTGFTLTAWTTSSAAGIYRWHCVGA